MSPNGEKDYTFRALQRTPFHVLLAQIQEMPFRHMLDIVVYNTRDAEFIAGTGWDLEDFRKETLTYIQGHGYGTRD
jgi:hypothetical protein